jgi:cytochrome c-type biogenesis protein CcmE
VVVTDRELHEPFEDEDDVDGLDLTPRTAPAVAGGDPGGGRRVAVLAVLGLLVVALGFMAYRGLSDATVFFRNADEAVAERDSLGTRRFRMQGTVVDGSVRTEETAVRFTIGYGGVRVDVRHEGDPPELFQPGIPVVLEGHWSESDPWFESDRILVKHSENYEADNPDRVADYVEPGPDSGEGSE